VSEIENWKSRAKKELGAENIIIIRTRDQPSILSNEDGESGSVITTPSFKNGIREYIRESELTDEDTVEKILDVHDTMCKKHIDGKELFQGCMWELKQLKWSNLFCYGEDNCWTPGKGVTCLIGGNHVGKSALIDILLYCITDQCTRGRTVSDFMNKSSTSFRVSALLKQNGITYLIIKSGTQKKNLSTALEFYSVSNGERVNLSLSSVTSTKQKIVSMFGNMRNMELSSFALQNNLLGLLEMGHVERKKELCQLLGLGGYDILNQRVKKECTVLTGELKEVTRQKNGMCILPKERESVITEELESLRFDIQLLQQKIEGMITKIATMVPKNIEGEQPKDMLKSINTLKKKRTGLEKKITYSSDFVLVEDRGTEYCDVSYDISEMENKLTSMPLDGDVMEKVTQLRDLDILQLKYDSSRDAKDKMSLFKVKYDLKIKTDTYHVKLKEYEENEKMKEKMNEKYAKYQKRVKKLKKDVNELRLKEREYVLALFKSTDSKQKAKEIEKRMKKLLDRKKTLQLYSKMVHVNGVPSYIIRKIIPHIQQCVNEFLSGIVQFSVRMEITDKSWLMYYENKDSIIPLECCSGFEMRITSLAIRLALRNITTLSYPNGMIFDEAFASADKLHRSNIGRIIECIRPRLDWLLVISHMEELQAYGDKTVTIHRTSNTRSRLHTDEK